jgi:hypothetical protein
VTDDDIVNMTDPELAAAGLPHDMEDDDDMTANAEALLGFSGSGGGRPARPTVTPTPMVSNTNSSDAVDTPTSSLGKRKSAVLDDSKPIEEEVNGEMIRAKAICKMCRSNLSAISSAGTGLLIRHQKLCKAKVANAARVQ